jgi:hypothetical protein
MQRYPLGGSMLLQIRDFIHRQQVVSVQQISREFHIDEQALQPMLDLWVNKGVIASIEKNTSCKTKCYKCGPKAAPKFYQIVTS